MILEPLANEDRCRLENEALEYSNDAALDQKVCAVTDVWVFPRSAVSIAIDALPIRAMRAVLSRKQWCSQYVVDYYDCSDIDPMLNGLLLSRRGFNVSEDGSITVWMSSSVFNELHSLDRRLARAAGSVPPCKPPRFAIADRFVAGAFADIDRATCIEKQAIGLAQIRGVVKVVYGGPGKMLSSHLLCWDNRNATISSQVPSVVRREQFQLILAGPMTSTQEVLLAKRHECSGDRVLRAHDVLRQINPLYSQVSFADTFVAENDRAPSITTQLQPSEAVDRLIAHARTGQATIACIPDETGDLERRESTIVESQTVLMETVDAGDEQDRLAHAFATVTGVKDAYVVRRSASLLKSNDPRYMELLFPHLLTFGIGGFTTERDHRYSPRSIVLHYLNLSTNRFAEDAMFKLVMFDFLSSKRVKNNVFLRVGRDPSLATTAMRVTPAQLKTAMRNRADQRKAWKDGRTFVPAPGSTAATSLLKSITASTTKMWGSNEERESMAKKVDAISILRGAPSIFWTLTPNPDCSIVCAFWTGCELPNGRPTSLSQCGELNMPCSAEMSRMVMSNTVVQARYYQICSHILIDILFGWDSKANKPKSQRGIFGYVEALVYALEQQGRLFVHHHGVAWVAGFPKTKSDWDRLLSSDDTKAKFEQYCASIFSSELPVYDSLEVLHCPLGNCRGQLAAVPIPAKYKHVLKANVAAPLVATCDVCETRFTEPQIASAVIDSQWNTLDDEHKAVSSVEAVIALRHRFGGLSDHPATASVQLSRLLLKDQVHSWTHTRSCVKGRTGTRCRYRFFRDLIRSTGFSSANEMEYRRRIGNQWLNSFIALWRRILHFNMDARVLWSGDGLQAARYALQYTMKRQVVLDNVAIMDLAFRTRTARELSLDATEFSLGLGRVLSLSHASAGVMEIGGPLATVILLEGGAVTLPCLFERLVLLEGLNLLDNLEVEASVITRNRQMFTETTISKYVNRPRCLEHICWFDYCTWFHRAGPPSSSPAEQCSFVPSTPEALRAHLKTHGYQYAEYPRVPEIIGPRLPDSSRLRNEDYVEQTELYYRMAALLYHPFRDVRVFLNSTGSAQDHFMHWNPASHASIARALEFHQQFYICLQIAQEFREKQRNCPAESGADEDACDDDDILHYAPSQQDTARAYSAYESVPPEYYDGGVDDDMDGNHGRIVPDAAAPIIDQLYLHSIGSSRLPPDEGESLLLSSSSVTNAQLRRFHVNDFDPITEFRVQQSSAIDGATPRPSVVATLLSSLRDLRHDRTRSPPARLFAYASIQDVSSFFTLNARQHVAFVMIAVPLLAKITGVTTGPAFPHIFDGTPVIITGAGGTGKSQIIAAVRALVASWDHPLAVSVVASTGIAAASLHGSTMHSSVGLGIKPAIVPPKIRAPSDDLLRQWAPVECVIADEVSMVDLGFFGIWAECLQYVKDRKGVAFGGMLAVLMFDHCQLRTVNGVPMFRTKTKDVSLTAAQEYGSELYQAIDKVVYLTDNMRFAQDPEWGQWLALGRLGIWPAGLRSYINSVADGSCDSSILPRGALEAISTDNESRAAVNEAAIRVAVRLLGTERKVYVIPAHLSRRLSPPEVVHIRRLPDNKTGHVPLFLQVYIGMPVRIKVNQCVSKGIANGAFGVVHHIDWQPGTKFSPHDNSTWLPSRPPINIYVDVIGHSSPTRYPSIPLQWQLQLCPSVRSLRQSPRTDLRFPLRATLSYQLSAPLCMASKVRPATPSLSPICVLRTREMLTPTLCTSLCLVSVQGTAFIGWVHSSPLRTTFSSAQIPTF